MTPESTRQLAPAADEPVRTSQEEGALPVRLAVTGGGLGVELYRPLQLGPVSVVDLSVVLPGLRYPVDLSGGVRAFRHRRGVLRSLGLRAAFGDLEAWLRPRLLESLGPPGEVRLWRTPVGIGVGLHGADVAVAFELEHVPSELGIRLVVARARTSSGQHVGLLQALRVVDTAFAGHAVRRGRIVDLTTLARDVTQAVLPALGMRAPSVRGVRPAPLAGADDEVVLALTSDGPTPALDARRVSSLELATLCAEADDALGRGELDAARSGYVSALERAPRQPEVVRLVAEIDAVVGGRGEAALGLLSETGQATGAGAVGARLLARTGDLDGAREAARRAATDEIYAPLASLTWLELARLETAEGRRFALDQAVGCAPSIESARWMRLEERARVADVTGALADAEALEAAARGARAKHAACTRAALSFRALGLVLDARRLYERALRYLPDDAEATCGLGLALIDVGRWERAVTLLERAIELDERADVTNSEALVALAEILASQVGDLPQAIARVRRVPSGDPRAVRARQLEAGWRARLGDVAGASLVYARMRDAIAVATEPGAFARALLEAARFEQDRVHDDAAAERHLALALRAAPRDRAILELYRSVAARVAAVQRASSEREVRVDESSSLLSDVGGESAPVEPVPATPRVSSRRHAALEWSSHDAPSAEVAREAFRRDPSNPTLVLALAAALVASDEAAELCAVAASALDEAVLDASERAVLAQHVKTLFDASRDPTTSSLLALLSARIEAST